MGANNYMLQKSPSRTRGPLCNSLTVPVPRHHLAPISGTIEPTDPSPLAAAWREIAEETTLTPASLALLRQGKAYTFRDPSVRREWTVFPFLFRLQTPAGEQRIQTDWGHEAWGWPCPAWALA